MKAFFQIAYFVVGIVQFFAVWDGTKYFLGLESFIGRMFAFFISLLLTYVPLLGSSVGVYGSINVWDWTITKSLILFFWYVPVFIIFVGFSFIADRK